jgi:DNA-binding CsgD family transcriptional regulator
MNKYLNESGIDFMSAAHHRSIGRLIDSLEQTNFWAILISVVKQYIDFDIWVVLVFSNEQPWVLSESLTNEDEPDYFQNYLNGLYLLDPFYLASQEHPRTGIVTLSEVAPERFFETDYYQKYYKLVLKDELSLNVVLNQGHTLSLSMGSKDQFSLNQVGILQMIEPWLTALIKARMKFEGRTEVRNAQAGSINYAHRFAKQNAAILTEREIEVSLFILSGLSSKEIAAKTSISPETVKVHRRNIYHKLGIKSHSDLYSLFLNE